MKGQDGLAGQAATHGAPGHQRAYCTGVPGNYLLERVTEAGLDRDHLCLRGNLARSPEAQRAVPMNI